MQELENVSYILLLIFSLLATTFSIWTLAIIYGMGRWNNYLMLIVCLTVSQLIYDFSLLLVPCVKCSIFAITFFRCFAGVATSLWTNAILLLVYYIVRTTKTINFMSAFWVAFATINMYSVVLSSVISASYTEHLGDDASDETFQSSSMVYYWTRIGSIIINFILYVYLQYTLSRRVRQFAVNDNVTFIDKDPVRELANRMKYYPLAQIFCRGAATWFECQYGYTTYTYIESAPLSYRAADIIYVMTLPSAGILFFFIFLANSPGALTYVKKGFEYYSCGMYTYVNSAMKDHLIPSSKDSNFNMRDTATLPLFERLQFMNLEELDENQLSDLIAEINSENQYLLSPSSSNFGSSTNPSAMSIESGGRKTNGTMTTSEGNPFSANNSFLSMN